MKLNGKGSGNLSWGQMRIAARKSESNSFILNGGYERENLYAIAFVPPHPAIASFESGAFGNAEIT
jgi:hypothetical protein